ncbi:hypothetical protein CLOP_g15233 [Closterium sp. NIES-67]|nr:hypothetical protein CLOP_g15233 [Closterium sp. NIES-67]
MASPLDCRTKHGPALAVELSSLVSSLHTALSDHKQRFDSFWETHRDRYQGFQAAVSPSPAVSTDCHLSSNRSHSRPVFHRQGKTRRAAKGSPGAEGRAALPLAAISSARFAKTPAASVARVNGEKADGAPAVTSVNFGKASASMPLSVASLKSVSSEASAIEERALASEAPAAAAAALDRAGNVEKAVTRPSLVQLLTHPVALLRGIPKDAAFFISGAVAGAAAKTVTAPLDRWKLMIQVKSVLPGKVIPPTEINLVKSFLDIGKEGGITAYWKGNLPQVMRIVPYSAVQLFAYELYKKQFRGSSKELSVPARLAAGACAGMTSTLVTYPLDVLRLRMALDTTNGSIAQVAMAMVREEGARSLYKGLGPALVSIAPYIALNFCAYDMIKRRVPEQYQGTPQANLVTALAATTLATVSCYPIDTIRRQMQMKGAPFNSMIEAFPGIVRRDGWLGLYRGFIANTVKNLPNSSVRLTTYDAVKNTILSGHSQWDRLVAERKRQLSKARLPTRQSAGAGASSNSVLATVARASEQTVVC